MIFHMIDSLGRWTRVEDPSIPEDFVLHFVAKILEQTDHVMSPHSVKYLTDVVRKGFRTDSMRQAP